MEKATKAESGGGTTSQPPRVAEIHQAEVRRGTKAESGGGATSQTPKVGQLVDPGAGLVEQKVVFKTELPHLPGGGIDQTELQL
jgi:hypothetical protein